QTLLIVRIAAYFVVYQVFVWAVFACEESIRQSLRYETSLERPWSFIIIRETILLTVGALFIWDAVKLAHKIVGPLYRFRMVVKAVTAGEEVPVIVLRQGDLLLEMRDDMNEMLKALEQRGAVTLKQAPAAKGQPVPV